MTLAAPAHAQSVPGWAPPPAPPCPFEAECGVVMPPLADSDPLGRTPRATYALMRHTGSGPAVGTVAYNPGGPGISAIQWAREMTAFLGPDFDILLVDPRGVGASGPLSCGMDDDTFVRSELTQRIQLAVCGENLGRRMDDYGTEAAADDLEAIRSRLGIEQLDLYGQSYGTILMSTYARRYPDRVRSLLLSGAYPQDADAFGRDRAAGLRNALRLVCARSQGRCRGPALLRDLRRLAVRLHRDPVDFSLTDAYPQRLDDRLLAYVTFFAAYHPARYGRLPRLVRAALGGRPDGLVRLAKKGLASVASLEAVAPTDAPIVSYAVYCTEAPLPYDPAAPLADRRAAFARAKAAIRRVEPFSTDAWVKAVGAGGQQCLEWPAHRLDPPAGGVLPKVPTLVVSGDLDAVAPPSDGHAVARRIPGARFIVVPNVGHVPEFDRTGCVARLMWTFLHSQRVVVRPCLRHMPAVPVR